MTSAQALRWLHLCADAVEREKDRLTELDAAIGDADHGVNLHRGFQKVRQVPDSGDTGAVLKAAGMALLSSVGGASGPLYGTFFLKAALHDDLGEALRAGVEGLAARGRASAGDKTMLDALLPAVEAFTATGSPEAAAVAAEEGAAATVPLVARKGRASYLGERSVGHMDPGAASAALLIRALAEALQESQP